MKSSNTDFREIAVGAVALLGIAVVVLIFVAGVVRLLNLLESDVAAAISAASATAIASVIALLTSKRYERRARILHDNYTRKTQVYEKLISVLFEALYAEKTGRKGKNENDTVKEMVNLTPKMIVWGSQEVIQVWNAIRSHDWKSATHDEIMILRNHLMIAIRKDLGNEVDKLENLDLLRLFIRGL